MQERKLIKSAEKLAYLKTKGWMQIAVEGINRSRDQRPTIRVSHYNFSK